MVKIKQYDPRPSRADPDARAARKRIEEECPHISMKEVAIKGGALCLLTAVAFFPWTKELEKIKQNKNRGDDEKRGESRDDRGYDKRGRRGGDDDRRERRRRRQSEGGERQQDMRMFLDRDREYRSVEGASESVGSGERYTGSEDGEYGQKHIEASRKEREYRPRGDEDEYRRRRRGSVDYEYRRSSRDDRRR